MSQAIINSTYFSVTVSILCYIAGSCLRKKTKLTVLNPLIISVIAVIAILVAVKIPYEDYKQNTYIMTYLLTPTTVCLALPLYEKLSLLKKNFAAVMCGIISGVLSSAICIFTLSYVFSLNHETYVTLLPKSITTAIGIDLSEKLGGIVSITAPVIVITGVFGSIISPFVFKLFKITEPIAKGIGLGSSAHAVGTSKAFEFGEIEGAMSGLSIAVSGIITVISAPFFAKLL